MNLLLTLIYFHSEKLLIINSNKDPALHFYEEKVIANGVLMLAWLVGDK